MMSMVPEEGSLLSNQNGSQASTKEFQQSDSGTPGGNNRLTTRAGQTLAQIRAVGAISASADQGLNQEGKY